MIRARLAGQAGYDDAGAVGRDACRALRRVRVAGLFEAEISERSDYRLLHRPGRRDPGDEGPVLLSAAARGARYLPASPKGGLDNPSSTTLLSNRRKLQRSYPSGDLEQARAIRRAS